MISRRSWLLVVNAIAWGCLLEWPWGQFLFVALGALALVHIAAPLLSAWREGNIARGFALGPLLLFLIDVVALYAAYTRDAWGDLTVVFVTLLAAAALIALGYAASVMTLIERRRRR